MLTHAFLLFAAFETALPLAVLWMSPHHTTPFMVAITAVCFLFATASLAGAWLAQIPAE